MSLFTSNRERNLWIWTAIVMAGLYSTLRQTRNLVSYLSEANLLTEGIFVGMFFLIAAIAMQGIKIRPRRGEIWLLLGITGIYLMAFLRFQISGERSHLIEYGLVSTLVYQALLERQRHDPRVKRPAFLAFLITLGLGWLDEGIQLFLPERFYDLRDVGFNGLAALMAIAASLTLAKGREWIEGWHGKR
jgi:hypothetical protein